MTDYPDGTALRLYVLDNVELVKLIELIQQVDKIVDIETLGTLSTLTYLARIGKIDEIVKVTGIDAITLINAIKSIDSIGAITEVKKLSKFGETGTITYIAETATADILTPSSGYRTRILGGVLYNPTDIQAYLRWKTSGNFIFGVPTIGFVDINPIGLKHPLGAVNEVLELYMSAAGTVKGWVITDEVYGTATSHSKTITEILGLKDSVLKTHTPPTGSWVLPTSHFDENDNWTYETWGYDNDLETEARHYYIGYQGTFLQFIKAAGTCTKVRIYLSVLPVGTCGYVLEVYKDDAWVSVADVDENNTWNDWIEHSFAAGSVTKMRIGPKNMSGDISRFNVHEANFWELT